MLHGVADDGVDGLVGQLLLQHGVEQAGEVAVHALVARDQLVGKGQPRHQAALLEPEDSAEGAREEDALDDREGNEALGEARGLIDPLEGPGRLSRAGGWVRGCTFEFLARTRDDRARRSAGKSDACGGLTFLRTHGTVSMALKRLLRFSASRMYVSMSRLYVSEWMFSMAIWKP